MTDRFRYDLRYSFDPKTFSKQQEQDLMAFLDESTTNGVTFFINQEELNRGHVTDAEADDWLKIIKEITPKLQAKSLKVSINPWTTLLHSDRGPKVNPILGFSPMVDYTGESAVAVACPADPHWQKYIARIYAHYATVKPDFLWLEDDFKHYKHTPHITLGCFCERHMQIYAQKLGSQISRADFVERILQAGKPTKERQIYLTVARQEMITTAKKIEKRVHEVSPQTKLGLMCSFPEMHAMEGRDWHQLFKALAGTVGAAVRPHLPAYEEVAGVIYSRKFNQYTRTTAALVPDQTLIFPELENYMYSPYAKSKRFTQFQLESTALLPADGILLNLYDMIGSGVVKDFDYAAMLRESRPLMDFLSQHRFRKPQGIKVLLNQDESFERFNPQPGTLAGLYPTNFQWQALLSTFGIPAIPEFYDGQDYHDEIIAISGQGLRGVAPEKVKKLLTNNFVILDGAAIQVVIDLGLKEILNVKQSQWYQPRTNYQSFEQYRMPLAGIEKPRVSMLQHIGAYLQIKYQDNSDTIIFSDAYNAETQTLGPVMTLVNQRTLLMPLDVDPKYGYDDQYTNFKALAFQKIFEQYCNLPFVVNLPAVNVSTGEINGQRGFLLVNFSLDDYPQITLNLPGVTAQRVMFNASWRDGAQVITQKVVAQKKNNFYQLNLPLNGLSLLYLVAE